MNILKIENRFHVELPNNHEIRKKFKSTFSSYKWHPETKTWSVGPRSGKKLEIWCEEMASKLESATNAIKERQEILSKMKPLSGHTFDFKEELKEKFSATWDGKNKKWCVSEDFFDEASEWLEAQNKKRNQSFINKEDVINCEKEVSKTLELIEKTIDNFEVDEYGGCEYKYQDDDFYSFIKYEDATTVRNQLTKIYNAIGQYSVFADENDNRGIQFDDQMKSLTDFFEIPLHVAMDFDYSPYVFIDYAVVIQREIKERLSLKLYKKVERDGVSKELDDDKHSPKFTIKHKETGITVDVTNMVDVKREESSRRVHIYNAYNIPVLNDERFCTVVLGWKNRYRTLEIHPQEI